MVGDPHGFGFCAFGQQFFAAFAGHSFWVWREPQPAPNIESSAQRSDVLRAEMHCVGARVSVGFFFRLFGHAVPINCLRVLAIMRMAVGISSAPRVANAQTAAMVASNRSSPIFGSTIL